jgi:DNA polymerase
VSSPLTLVADEARICVRCALAEGRTQVVFGMGDPHADLLFVGEGPGAEEDRQGLPFVGRSGKLLDQLLIEEVGITRDRCYIANVVKCRPPGNRDPKPDEIAACRPWLDAQLQHLAPKVVVTLGNFATKTLLDTTTGITKLRGKEYPFGAAVLIPTFHPAAVLRGGAEPMARMRADLVRAKLALTR